MSSLMKTPNDNRMWIGDNIFRLSREDGPAVERNDGYKAWFVDGHLHREDGPAEESGATDRAWFRDGTYVGGEWNGRVLTGLSISRPLRIPPAS